MKRVTVMLNDEELKNFQQIKNILRCRTMSEQFRGIIAFATKKITAKKETKND